MKLIELLSSVNKGLLSPKKKLQSVMLPIAITAGTGG